MQTESLETEPFSTARLYRLWEENNWSAAGIDFTLDAEHWHERFDERQREAALWNYALFLTGEEAVARTLTPLVDAVPDHEAQNFLATQLVDEVRHHVFFDRFLREVAGVGADTASTLRGVDPYLTWGFRQIFSELDRTTEALRRSPRDRALFARSLALYHVVVEGTLAVPGQHFIRRYLEAMDVLPGFTEGIANVARDESRHVAFGVGLLGRLVRSSQACRDATVEVWDEVLPYAAGVFRPPGLDTSYVTCFGFTITEIIAFGLRSFETKARRVGIDPTEITLLARDDVTRSYEDRAQRIWDLIRCKALGTEEDPDPTPEVMEVVFEGVARIIDPDVLRSLGGGVQWEFPDAAPWHVVAENGGARAVPGRTADPGLVLRCPAGEWVKIALDRADPRRAVLTRTLRPEGPWRAKAKLPGLFGMGVLRGGPA